MPLSPEWKELLGSGEFVECDVGVYLAEISGHMPCYDAQGAIFGVLDADARFTAFHAWNPLCNAERALSLVIHDLRSLTIERESHTLRVNCTYQIMDGRRFSGTADTISEAICLVAAKKLAADRRTGEAR